MSRTGRRLLPTAVFLTAIALALTVALLRYVDGRELPTALSVHTPGELIRYAKLRLQGHTRLEAILLGPLNLVQSRVERPVPPTQLPTLGKGQQSRGLAPVRYLPDGQPKADSPPPAGAAPAAKAGDLYAATAAEIVLAVNAAKAGQTVWIAPGRYTLTQRVNTGSAGSKDLPITVRASEPGQVTIEFATQEGFNVSQPFWVFENLHIRGVCKAHSDCDHAFHIVGKARSTVLRNNLMENFNAQVKVNGENGDWPDDGLLQYNTLTNTGRRDTSLAVTPIDIVGASRWQLADNVISNFVKADGDQVSYGVFMKGAGHGGRIERNLIICTTQGLSQAGLRVGLSFGGGGTGKPYCRDQRCDAEYKAGLAANNIVAHCNDFGMDVNRSRTIVVAHNTLINTAGIDVRGVGASATVYGNLLEGRIRQRDGGQVKRDMNELVPLGDLFENPDSLKLGWRKPPENIPSLALVPADFCGQTRSDGTLPGAMTSETDCLARSAR